MQRVLTTSMVLGAGLILVSLPSLFFAEEFAVRANFQGGSAQDNLILIHAFGAALLASGVAVLAEPEDADSPTREWACLPIVLMVVVYFLLLGRHLHNWWIDDAGITFAYSLSLAEGLGLRAQPWLPAEEGYSSTTWMLLLSTLARAGLDIPTAAKIVGLGCTALSILLCGWIVSRETRSPLAVIVCGIGIASGPSVVWAASGQEHALQALLLVATVLCAYHLECWRRPVAVLLSVFVLSRPEAPIIVICVFLAAVFLTRQRGGALLNVGDAAVALLPFVTFLGLMGFRMVYFGDLMPNPYYAKSDSAGFLGVLNPLGGGWSYVLSGLRDTALVLMLPLLLVIRARRVPDWLAVAIAILIGHVVFVIWAKGDWMGQYRFLMPILPIFMLVAVLGLRGLGSFRVRILFSVGAVLILLQTTISQLSEFKAAPTTPLAAVQEIGEGLRALAERLEIEDPLLAHHDAGAIAYYRMIRLVDLGGLINRQIAKNMHDMAFLKSYLLEDLRPDFFFGARNFAMSSGLSETEAFQRDYVRLDFPDRPALQSEMTYVRRDRVKPIQGITTVRDESGRLERVIIHGSDHAG